MERVRQKHWVWFRKAVAVALAVSFSLSSVSAQTLSGIAVLPEPGKMINLSQTYNPPVLKGVKVDPNNPLRFDFILDKGDSNLAADVLKDESGRLTRYFLASLTVPEKDLWVNLSPYEEGRIIANEFGQTEMGRDLLAQDYILKQLTASVIYPESDSGKRFWAEVYKKAFDKYGTTDIPVDTFNKVWIVPEKAVVYEKAAGVGSKTQGSAVAYIVDAKLKVMLESDYLAAEKSSAVTQGPAGSTTETQELAKQVVREVIIPVLEKEVNEGQNFAQLRQVYYSLILAAWYKRKVKDSLLNSVYVDQKKIAGVNIDDPKMAEKIWMQYVEAFKKGVFNYVKEERDELSDEVIPRKYFSGGIVINMDKAMSFTSDGSFLSTPGKIGRVVALSLALVAAIPGASAIHAQSSVNVVAADGRTVVSQVKPAELKKIYDPLRSNLRTALGMMSGEELIGSLVSADLDEEGYASIELSKRGAKSLPDLLTMVKTKNAENLHKKMVMEQLRSEGISADKLDRLNKIARWWHLFAPDNDVADARFAKASKISLSEFRELKQLVKKFPSLKNFQKAILLAIREINIRSKSVIDQLREGGTPEEATQLAVEWGGQRWYEKHFLALFLGTFFTMIGGLAVLTNGKDKIKRNYWLARSLISGDAGPKEEEIYKFSENVPNEDRQKYTTSLRILGLFMKRMGSSSRTYYIKNVIDILMGLRIDEEVRISAIMSLIKFLQSGLRYRSILGNLSTNDEMEKIVWESDLISGVLVARGDQMGWWGQGKNTQPELLAELLRLRDSIPQSDKGRFESLKALVDVNALKVDNFQKVLRELGSFWGAWKEQNGELEGLPAFLAIAAANNKEDVFQKPLAILREWIAIFKGGGRNLSQVLKGLIDSKVITPENFERVSPDLLALAGKWNAAGGTVGDLRTLLSALEKDSLITESNYESVFENILFAKNQPEEFVERLYENIKAGVAVSPDTFQILIQRIPLKTFAKQTGINIKLVRYLYERKNFLRLKDKEFREAVDAISYELNRERTEHPSVMRLGEDQKTALFDLLFSEGFDYKTAVHVFRMYFYNDPDQYSLPIENLKKLFEHLAPEKVRNTLRMIQDDPKRGLEEFEADVKNDLEQRIKNGEQLDVDAEMRSLLFTISNLLVNGAVRPLALTEVVNEQMPVEDTGLPVEEGKLQSFESILVLFIKGKATGSVQNFLLSLERGNKYSELSKVADLFNVPVEEVVKLKVNTIAKLNSREKFIMNVLETMANPDYKAKMPKSIQGLVQSFFNDLPQASQKRIYVSLNEKNKLPDFLRELGLAASGEISGSGQEVSSAALKDKIPHLFFEPLLRLNASDRTLDQFMTLIQAVNGIRGSATIKNRLYEYLRNFSVINDARKEKVFSSIMDILSSKQGTPEKETAEAWATGLLEQIHVFGKALEFDNLPDGEARSLTAPLLTGLLEEQKVNVDLKTNFLEYAAKKALDKLISTVNASRWFSSVSAAEKEQLIGYYSSLRAQWRDHEGRSIYELLDVYLSHISKKDNEVHNNMFEGLLAEARGSFRSWKYQSQDYLALLDSVTDIYIQELSADEQKELQQAIKKTKGRGVFEKLMNVKKLQDKEWFTQLRDRLEKIRNWELVLSLDAGNGTRAEFTDDFYALVNIGNYPGSTSCQSVTYSTDLNRGLEAYVANGTIKAMTFIDAQGRVIPARRIVRLIIAEKDGKKFPAIFVEESTQFGVQGLAQLYSLMDELSRRTGLPVITSSHRPAESLNRLSAKMQNINVMIFEGRATFVYSDAYGYHAMLDAKGKPVETNILAGLFQHPRGKGALSLESDIAVVVNEPKTGENDKKILVTAEIVPDLVKDNAQSVLDNDPTVQPQAPGGIDLNPVDRTLQIGASGDNLMFKIDPAMVEKLRASSGFSPVILNIQPVLPEDLPMFLGLTESSGSVS